MRIPPPPRAAWTLIAAMIAAGFAGVARAQPAAAAGDCAGPVAAWRAAERAGDPDALLKAASAVPQTCPEWPQAQSDIAAVSPPPPPPPPPSPPPPPPPPPPPADAPTTSGLERRPPQGGNPDPMSGIPASHRTDEPPS